MCGLQKDLGRGGVLAELRSSFWMEVLIRTDRQGEKQMVAEQKARMDCGENKMDLWQRIGCRVLSEHKDGLWLLFSKAPHHLVAVVQSVSVF